LALVNSFTLELDKQAGVDAIAMRGLALIGEGLALSSADLCLTGVTPEPSHYAWQPAAGPLAALRRGSPPELTVPATAIQPLTAAGIEVAVLRAFRPAGELAADERGLLYILAICLALAIRIAQLARGLELAERAKLPPPTAAPPELLGCEALTGREMAVLLEIAGGAKTTTIATRLSISARAVEAHLTAIYGKLQVSSRAHAVARAHYLGLLSATGSAP
jgi:DNA-binding CsgD family transcriptional regulator